MRQSQDVFSNLVGHFGIEMRMIFDAVLLSVLFWIQVCMDGAFGEQMDGSLLPGTVHKGVGRVNEHCTPPCERTTAPLGTLRLRTTAPLSNDDDGDNNGDDDNNNTTSPPPPAPHCASSSAASSSLWRISSSSTFSLFEQLHLDHLVLCEHLRFHLLA